MSQLYYSETGHVMPTLCEELTDYRRARKVLDLPGTRAPAVLFVLARSYPDTDLPLRVSANGRELPGPAPDPGGLYRWHQISVPADVLVPGSNMFEFWADAPAMNAWSLAMENGHRDPNSFVSTNAGTTWRNEKMSYLNVTRGEYIVRVRLEEGADPAPPAMAWEDPQHPRLQRLRQTLPSYILEGGSTLGRVRALATQVCTSWEYCNSGPAAQYAPWDAETIVAWGQASQGHDGRKPIVMCVHYAVTLVTYCLAAGIPARCAVFTLGTNTPEGHFTAEVWFEEYGKWVMVDPNMDAILFKEGLPMSVSEIQRAAPDLAPLVAWGPGHRYQLENPVIAEWVPKTFLTGVCFRHRSLWARTDLLSHPEFSPPGHGSTSYCETNLIWEVRDLKQGFGMFPYFGEDTYFDAPPRDFPA